MITSSITLGSIVFGDVEFEGWSFKDLIDWWGQTEDKLDVVERPQAHGAFDVTRSLRTSRAISFTGTFIGSAQADVENAFDDLSAVGAEGPVEMVVSTPAGATMRTVTVESVTPVDHHGRRYGRYSVDLIARDPRRYDVNAQSESTTPAQPGLGRTWPAVWPLVWPGGGSSGRITLTNTGKAPSAPTFILEGGFDTALITCLETGARIGLNRQIPVGSEVVIDTKTRRATIDGQSDVSRWLQYREWELIPPGASRTYQFDATGVVVTPGSQVEIGRNLNLNPRLMNSVNGWVVNSSVATMAPTLSGAQVDVTLATSAALFFQSADFPAVAGDRWAASMEISVPLGYPAASVDLRVFAYGSNAAVGSSGTVVIQPGTTVTVTANSSTPLAASATGVRSILYGAAVASGVRILIRNALAVKAAVAGAYFDGYTAPRLDRTYAWAATPDASASIEYQVFPDEPVASLEGQVRSAWW